MVAFFIVFSLTITAWMFFPTNLPRNKQRNFEPQKQPTQKPQEFVKNEHKAATSTSKNPDPKIKTKSTNTKSKTEIQPEEVKKPLTSNPKSPYNFIRRSNAKSSILPDHLKVPEAYKPLKNKVLHSKMLNGVDWIHIKDPTTKTCSAAFGINVGSFQEFEGNFAEGTAHLLQKTIWNWETGEVENPNLIHKFAYTTAQSSNFIFSCRKKAIGNLISTFWDRLTLFKADQKVVEGQLEGLQNQFEEIKEDPKWKHSITLSLLTENNHPSSKFAFGNQASLEDKDLTKKLTKFYNDYYSLSKIKIVTLCDNDSSKQFLDLMKIFLKINRKISSKASRATYFQPPYLEKNKLVMIKSEKKETVIITKYLKVNQSNDFSFLHFLLFIIDRALDEKMIKRELLAEDVVSYFEIYDNYVALHAKIDVSLKGRKKLQPILDVYNQVITGIGKLLTKEVYQRVRKEQYTRMMFRNRLDSNADFADELLNNFQNFDIDFLFSGDLELQEEFDGVALRSILGEIKSSKTIVTVLGDFRLSPHLEKVENKAKRRVLGSSKRGKTGHNLFNRKESKKKEEEKKKLKPVWPTVSQSEVLNNARIAGSFKIEDLLKGRLVDFSFLGATRINGRADILGQVELGFRHPAFGVEFGYIDFPGEISKSIDAGFMQYRKNIFEYSQENFDAVEKEFSDKVRDQLSQKPLTKVSQSLITIANTKDPLHEVTIFVELYLEKSPTKEENCNLEIISQAWRARLRLVNQDLSSLVSNIEIKPKNGMLIVKIDTMIEILHPVLATFMQEIFGTPQLSRDETDRALDNEYNRITNYEDLFMQTAAMLRSHLLSKHKFLRKEKLAHMRKIAKKDLQTPKFRVGRLFLEGYILPQVTQKVITDLAQKIDQKYNEKKEFNISPFKTWLDVPTTPTVIAFPTQNQDQELKPFGHFYHLQHSYNYKELAKVWTLQKILGELSNKLLVKKHNLNTVLKVGMLEIENDHVFLYLWAETKDVKKTSSLLENFYREAEGEFLKLNKQKINEHLLNLKDELNEIPPSLIKHAERDYDFINYGLYEEFVKNIVSEMFTTITKEVLLDKFKEIFMQSAGSKIVIDGSYSREQIENDKVGLHNYNINDAYNKQKKYSVVKIPD